ncbi:MAG: sugar phosphate nucleotidyltransferase [Candidatus Margulisbacteria bacterium]|nr:sugar phosphate nucleotidyltransferase [Candidatus Margulisiibacteriota bacterium]
MFNTIILAAGKGTRLKTESSKVAVELINKPIILHLLDNISKCIIQENTYLIIGHKGEEVQQIVQAKYPNTQFVWQKEQLGTGHAVAQVEPVINMNNSSTLILAGDVPLVSEEMIKNFFEYHSIQKSDVTVLTTKIDDPKGYGRIIRDASFNRLLKIVEEKDADETEKKICEINSGIYLVKTSLLFSLLKEIKPNNKQKEFYLTDIIKIGNEKHLSIHPYLFHEYNLLRGINSRHDLSNIAQYIYKASVEKHLSNGITLLSPETTFIEPEVKIEQDVVIEPFVHLKGKTFIKQGSRVCSHVYLQDYISKPKEMIKAYFKN